MIQALRALHSLSVGLALSILVTGGTVLKFSNFTLELNRLEVFFVVAAFTGWILIKKGQPLPLTEKIVSILSQPWASLGLFVFTGLTLWLAHLFRHWGMFTNAYDTTFVHQALKYWNGSELLHCDLCIGGSYLGEHTSFSFLAVSPLIGFLKADEWIFAIQFLCLLLPALLLITHGPLKGSKSLWFLPIVALISFRAFRNSMVWDFREDHLAFAFLSFSLLALYHHRFLLYFVTLIAALLSKENVGFVVLLFGVAMYFIPEIPITNVIRKRVAVITIFISLAYLALAWGALLPYFTRFSPQASNLLQRFPGFGSTNKETLHALLTSPAAWIAITSKLFLQASSLKYVVLCLLPFIYFVRHVPLLLLPVAGGIAMNLISSANTQRSLQFHYELIFLPFLLFGFLLGFKKSNENKSLIASFWFVPLSLALVGFGKSPQWEVRANWPDRPQLETSFFLRSFKTQEVLAADDVTLAQLSHLPHLRRLVLPDSVPESESVLNSILLLSTPDRTGQAGHSLGDARVWAIHTLHPLAGRIGKELAEKGWTKISNQSLPLAEIWISPT